ncbi:expressed unknown protein [Seminavis robusta]|uniref:Uncharacterized protein n=1 Tax=Seminavis robusta TaxID=568900 RepID=A0A9N8D6M3_9STRA|nr:expressed unknown protein [Seminavis robusta]|eukprot:Sro20_g013810.1 n/a (696) ;mRNA; r:4804-6969
MRVSYKFRLLAILALVCLALYKMSSFQRSTQEDYLRFMLSGRSTEGISTNSASTNPWMNHNPPNICQALPPAFQHATPLSLWTQHLDYIHKASQLLPQDPDYEFSDLTAQLLHLISPRLPNSIKTVPRDLSSVRHVLEKVLWPRWQYIIKDHTDNKLQEENIPRPVRVVVMGGSVVAGINCQQVFAKKVKHKLSQKVCAWPHRLQSFLDQIVESLLVQRDNQNRSDKESNLRLFQVHTVVMGGSNTISGNAILEFDLLPPEAKNPDIIINAYSTNDMHLNTFYQQGDTNNHLNGGTPTAGSWREMTLPVLQDFIRLAHSPLPQCSSSSSTADRVPLQPPVILHLDDYLGNEQREILATTELSQAVHVLANYYGIITALSYADMVRDWVYGDTHEFWFSPFGWYRAYKLDKSKMVREIHPGMPMHMVVPWIVSYAFLTLWTTYCDGHAFAHDARPQEQSAPSKKVLDDEYEIARWERGLPLPALWGNTRFPGKPHAPPRGLPPPLHPDLSLQEVSTLWKNESDATAASSCVSPENPKCPFAWVSGLLSDHNALDEATVETYFREHSLEFHNQGWKVRRHVDGKKIGYVPELEQPGATMTLVFGGGTIRQVVVFYLKSYGERWEQSRLRIQLDRVAQGSSKVSMLTKDLVGFHGKNTSEMYVERMVLAEPITQERLRLEARFESGKVFKIMGLLVCR